MDAAVLLLLLSLCSTATGTLPNPPALASAYSATREQLMRLYFLEGYDYETILCFLNIVHGISLCTRQLKRILRTIGLRRRVSRYTVSHFRSVERLIKKEIKCSGSLLGYRSLCKRLRQKYGCVVSRDTVMKLLAYIDPDGSEIRRQHKLKRRTYYVKGPNYLWHLDGYDKLKHYGFAIHGCIDGFSRRILWLEVGTTNNDPKVIAGYYLEGVRKLRGAPRILRADCGTENTVIAALQPFLRRHGTDDLSEKSFLYGKSVSNQRIEAWWSQLRRSNSDWWLHFFERLKYEGHFNETNAILIDCLRFSFMGIIQSELDKVVREWNTHRIRQNCARDHLCVVDSGDLDYIEQYTTSPDPPAPVEFLELAEVIMEEENLHMPHTVGEALNLYIELLNVVD